MTLALAAVDGSTRNVVAFYRVWIHKAVSRETGKTVAWVIGGRDADTFRRLFDKVKHLSDCQYYTDNWEAFAKVLPAEQMNGRTGEKQRSVTCG